MEQKFNVLKSKCLYIYDGEDQAYCILDSGIDQNERYILVDVGPHFSGDTAHYSEQSLIQKFNGSLSEPDFDSLKNTGSVEENNSSENVKDFLLY